MLGVNAEGEAIAYFALAPVCLNKRGNMIKVYLYIMLSSITFCVAICSGELMRFRTDP